MQYENEAAARYLADRVNSYGVLPSRRHFGDARIEIYVYFVVGFGCRCVFDCNAKTRNNN